MEAVSVENPLVAKALAAAPTGVFINGAWRAARGGEWTHGQVQRILNRYADLRSATPSADGSSGS